MKEALARALDIHIAEHVQACSAFYLPIIKSGGIGNEPESK